MGELVSVIMSTYNEQEEWLRLAVESILNQTYKDIEFIIIIDNPNNSSIIQIINEYENYDNRIKVIVNEKNIGLVNSLNKGIKYSNGNYIARMDADDISDLYRIEKQMDLIKNNKDIDLLGCGIEYINENGVNIYKSNIYGTTIKSAKKSLNYSNIIAHPTWLFKKEVFNIIGGYRNIKYAEDYDFLLRSIDNGFNVVNINDVLLKYRIRNNSISRKNEYYQYCVWNLLRSRKYNEIEKIRINTNLQQKYEESNVFMKKSIENYKRKRYIKMLKYAFKTIMKSKERSFQFIALLKLRIINKI
ncbi:glycosyltransferase [Clostridium perfringens]|nr:glycosyltransferase [Clostridium perfringens]